MKQLIAKAIGGLAVLGVIIFIACVISSCYQVETGEVAIISTWGKVSRIDTEGLNFKIPIVQSKKIMTVRDRIYSFDKMSVSTKDMQSILLDLTIQVSVSDPQKLYTSFKGLHEENFINPRTREVVQASVSKYTIEEFVSKRQELSKMIYEDLKDDFQVQGLSVVNVSIINHDFSIEYEKAIEAKKVAEQAVEKTRFEQEKLRVEAENRVLVAEQELKVKRLKAAANEVEAKSLTPILIQKMAVEKWDGKLPQVQSGSDNGMLINIK